MVLVPKRSGEALLLQNDRSGPLGSAVLLMDVEITSEICGSRVSKCSIQRNLHDDNLENDLHDGRNNCRGGLMWSRATMRCCPIGVVGELELHGQKSRSEWMLSWCEDPVEGLMPLE